MGSVVAGNPAEIYQQYGVAVIFKPWAADLVGRASPRPGERVLDLACGTGVVARTVAPLVGPSGTVTALDLNPGMLAVARALPPVDGPAIDWREGNASALPFPDQSFDLLLCQEGFQFFPDKPAALQEMKRVLAPGGRIAISVWGAIEQNRFGQVLGEIVNRHFGAPHLYAAFALSDPAELQRLLDESGLEEVTVEKVDKTIPIPGLDAYIRATIVGAAAAILGFPDLSTPEGQKTLDSIVAEMVETLAPGAEVTELPLQFEANVGLGRRGK